MSNIAVEKVANGERSLPVFKAMNDLIGRIRERAFALGSQRGFGDGHALEDWLTAEREFCWPASELKEGKDDFALSVALPGFEPGDVSVTATPREIIVHAKYEHTKKEPAAKDEKTVCWSEFRSDDVYRRIELNQDINVEKITATLKDGMLSVTAPKIETAKAAPAAAAS